MFTVKFLRYDTIEGRPTHTERACVRMAKAVHARFTSKIDNGSGHTIVQLGDAPDETMELTVGGRDGEYSVAYVMNEAGRTMETIR